MPRILSFGQRKTKIRKDNIFKLVWDGFNSLDRFIKFYIFYGLLIITVTPAIISGYLIFNPHAATTAQIGTAVSSTPNTSLPILKGGSTLAQPAGIETYAVDQEIANELTLLNNWRAAQNPPLGPLGSLTADKTLTDIAKWMSNDMATNNYIGHTDSLGRDPFTRMAQCLCPSSYDFNTWKGENIAVGYAFSQDVFNVWKNDPLHNAIMLGSNYTAVGIYRAYNPNSTYGWYWVEDFGGYIEPNGAVSYVTPPPPPPPPNGAIQGIKVLMPGNSTSNSTIDNQPVSLDGGFADTENPYGTGQLLVYPNWNSLAVGSTHTISVPPLSGYTIGYTLCYSTQSGCAVANDPNNLHRATPTPATCNAASCSVNVTIPTSGDCGGGEPCADLWWHYTLLKGDANCDGNIDTTDELFILRYMSGLIKSSTNCQSGAINFPTADVDVNGIIDGKDALQILYFLDCLPSSIPNTCPMSAAGSQDSDGDGFNDSTESFIGTVPNMKCSTTTITKPGILNPNWPPDFNNDNKLTSSDLLAFSSHMNSSLGTPNYNSHFDLTGPKGIPDGNIDNLDVSLDNSYFGKTCISPDSDGDGFTDDVETYIGTNPSLKCGPNNWPPDFNNDNKVNTSDTLSFSQNNRFNSKLGDPVTGQYYNKRWDLNGDGAINTSDLLKLSPYFNKSCQ